MLHPPSAASTLFQLLYTALDKSAQLDELVSRPNLCYRSKQTTLLTPFVATPKLLTFFLSLYRASVIGPIFHVRKSATTVLPLSFVLFFGSLGGDRWRRREE
jgi:hypothetical protein